MKLTITLKGRTPYSQSKQFTSEPKEGEDKHQFEKRAWKEKAHFNDAGQVVIPTFGLKTMLDNAASFLGMKVPGDAKRGFTRIFMSGIQVQDKEPVLLVNGKPITEKDITDNPKDAAHGEWISANSDGKRGGGKRVPRCFPVYKNWETTVEFEAIDPRISKDILLRHLAAAGQYIGIGRFRAEKGGHFGRFDVICDGKLVAAQTVEKKIDETEGQPTDDDEK